jgi:hypothetical protein
MTLALLNNPDLQHDSKLDDVENFHNDRKGQAIQYLSEATLIQVKTYGTERRIGNFLTP